MRFQHTESQADLSERPDPPEARRGAYRERPRRRVRSPCISAGYGFYTPYSRIPTEYRTRYGLDADGRYIYRNGRLYVIDPATQIVSRIVDGL